MRKVKPQDRSVAIHLHTYSDLRVVRFLIFCSSSNATVSRKHIYPLEDNQIVGRPAFLFSLGVSLSSEKGRTV